MAERRAGDVGTVAGGRVRDVGTVVVLAALATRLVGVAVTSLTSLNTYAESDVTRFAAAAAEAAARLASGRLPPLPTDPNHVVTMWGLVLSPLWLLPGPSRLYGRLFTVVLGTLAVYLLYLLASSLHSRRAGVVAATPLILYPSYVAVHGTILREAFVLVGLVGVTYLLVGDPSWPASSRARGLLALAVLGVVTLVRWENAALYGVVLATGMLVRYREHWPRPRLTVPLVGVAGLVAGWTARSAVRSGLEFLLVKRRRRIRGRTVYLADAVPETIPSAFAFALLGAVYFLFVPFPWMVETLADAVASVEGLGNVAAVALATLGVRKSWRRSAPVTAALVVGLCAGSLLYGFVNANAGTSVRQRQMFLWVVFLFAGVAVAERVDADRWPSWLR